MKKRKKKPGGMKQAKVAQSFPLSASEGTWAQSFTCVGSIENESEGYVLNTCRNNLARLLRGAKPEEQRKYLRDMLEELSATRAAVLPIPTDVPKSSAPSWVVMPAGKSNEDAFEHSFKRNFAALCAKGKQYSYSTAWVMSPASFSALKGVSLGAKIGGSQP